MFHWINHIVVAIAMLFIMAVVISKAADQLGDALHVLGIKLKIPNSVRGATFDAVSSSFPEFSTAMVAVIVYKQFTDIGLPTIAGSGIFNILLIPMLSIFVYRGSQVLKADKASIYRDMLFYSVSILALIFMAYTGQFTFISGIILIGIYVVYIITLSVQSKKYSDNMTLGEEIGIKAELQQELEEEGEESEFIDMSYKKIFSIVIVTMTIIWVSTDAIVQSAIVVSETLKIPTFIVSVVILAACTSIPDTLLSIKSAKLGDADGAVSNAVGSNIFDICICLGVPMLIAGKSIPVNLSENLIIFVFLILSMLTTALILLKKNGAKRSDTFFMGAVYVCFIIYIVCVGLTIIPLNAFV
ncbi:MAG: sodium:calcium antiporter [Clostridia bacterium]|nr:sodium:calcium antiporter [Clostridia bacterium]